MTPRAFIVALALLAVRATAAAIHPAADCAPADAQQGTEDEAVCYSLKSGGELRLFRVYAKPHGTEAAAVLIVLHGAGSTGAGMERLTRLGFNRIADREGAIIVYPDGLDKTWRDGRQELSDLRFLRALPRALAAAFRVDPLRIYATGLSNGGLMSYRLACDAADIYTAVAAVAANMPRSLASRCKPSHAVSIVVINGTEDPVMPWAGRTTIDRWLHLDHCDALHEGEKVDAIADDHTLVIPRAAKCLDDVDVQLYEVRGGGHTWPSGEPALDERATGRVSREIDANEVIWNFLVQHRLGGNAVETKL